MKNNNIFILSLVLISVILFSGCIGGDSPKGNVGMIDIPDVYKEIAVTPEDLGEGYILYAEVFKTCGGVSSDEMFVDPYMMIELLNSETCTKFGKQVYAYNLVNEEQEKAIFVSRVMYVNVLDSKIIHEEMLKTVDMRTNKESTCEPIDLDIKWPKNEINSMTFCTKNCDQGEDCVFNDLIVSKSVTEVLHIYGTASKEDIIKVAELSIDRSFDQVVAYAKSESIPINTESEKTVSESSETSSTSELFVPERAPEVNLYDCTKNKNLINFFPKNFDNWEIGNVSAEGAVWDVYTQTNYRMSDIIVPSKLKSSYNLYSGDELVAVMDVVVYDFEGNVGNYNTIKIALEDYVNRLFTNPTTTVSTKYRGAETYYLYQTPSKSGDIFSYVTAEAIVGDYDSTKLYNIIIYTKTLDSAESSKAVTDFLDDLCGF
jgi:hypothetical protein